MAQHAKQDLKIIGSSSSPGGAYQQAKITGDGTINGNLDCSLLSCTGNANVKGALSTQEMKVRGNLNVLGELIAGKLMIQGQSDVAGDANFREGSISGMMTVGGCLRSERLNVKGGLTVEANCAVETMDVAGSCNIKGLLNVGRLDMSVNWPSEVREIGGEWIQVRKGSMLKNLISFLPSIMKVMPDAKLKSDIIEGDRISLEHTCANVVRGNEITIGPGCEIGRVEYRTHFTQDPDSRIAEVVRV
ncbi:polymer-forming cytoskeletal protein [Paenibacillus marinisediminis]